MKFCRQLTALLTCAAFFISSRALPVMADVPYVNSGAVMMSGGSPYIYILGLVGQSSCTVASSTGAGTIAVEVSQDGITWTPLNIVTPSGTSAMTLALPGVGTSAVAAFANARAHLTAGGGGSVYFACGAGVGFGASSGGGGSVTVTNFPNPQNVNLTQVGSAVIGAATAAGTSATGNILGIQGVTGGVPIATTVTFPSTIAVTQGTSPWVSSIPAGVNVNNFPATQPVSGTVTANAGTGFPSVTAAGTSGTSLTTVQGSVSGVPVPVSGTVTVTPSGVQNVNQLQLGGATLGAATAIGTTASGLVQGIQGTTGGVPLPVSGTITANAGTGFPSTTAAGTSGTSLTTIQGAASGVALPVTGTLTGVSGVVSVATNQTSNADASAVNTVNGIKIYGFNGTNWDRIRTSTVGTSIAGGSVGALGIQGITGGVSVATSGTDNITQWGSAVLGAATAAGTSASGNILGIQGVTGGVPVNVTTTGSNPLKTVLTSASATACTNIEISTTGSVVALVNSSSSGLSVTLNLYDEGASPTCANADLMFSVQMAASQVILLNVPVAAGISYSLSSALTAGGNITVTRR